MNEKYEQRIIIPFLTKAAKNNKEISPIDKLCITFGTILVYIKTSTGDSLILSSIFSNFPKILAKYL